MRSIVLGAVFILLSLFSAETAWGFTGQSDLTELAISRVQYACSFLMGLYNPSLQLVRETPNRSVYYISSDNLLAENAFLLCAGSDVFPTRMDFITDSNLIRESINSCCSTGYDGAHEAILGVQITPLDPFPAPTTVLIANSTNQRLFRGVPASLAGGNYTVLNVSYRNSPYPHEWLVPCYYADISAYSALELERESVMAESSSDYSAAEALRTSALGMISCLKLMYDGKGIADEPYKNGKPGETGVYQPYKDALYMLALAKTNQPIPEALMWTLLRMQGPDGGFHTGYDEAGTFAGTLENAETTSIAMLVLSMVLPQTTAASTGIVQLEQTGLLAAAVAGIVVLSLKPRRKRTLSEARD